MDSFADPNELFDRLCPTDHGGVICPDLPGEKRSAGFVEAVRRRPGMYVGSTGAHGVYNLLCDILDLLVTLAPSRRDLQIGVEVSEEWIAFRSSGLAPERIPRHWAGMSLPVAAALSRRFQLFLPAEDRRVCRSFERGLLTGETRHPTLENQRIEVRIRPDPEIFTGPGVDYFRLFHRCHTLAALYPGIALSLQGGEQYNRFCFPEGIQRLLSPSGTGFGSAEPEAPLAFEREADGILIRCAIRKCSFPAPPQSYANGYRTPDGGAHVEGVWRGIAGALEKSGEPLYEEIGAHVRGRYEFAVAVWLDNPRYAGSVKRRIENEELVGTVADAVTRAWTNSAGAKAPEM